MTSPPRPDLPQPEGSSGPPPVEAFWRTGSFKAFLVGVALLAIIIVAGNVSDDDGGGGSVPGESVPAEVGEGSVSDESVAYKLAAIHGDLSAQDEFQRILDCVIASGIEGGETEEEVGDVLVASWEESAQRETLLEWAQAFC